MALVERADFGSGTSSRSTKLVHGGVRYLEQAVKRIDRSQFRLVREALRERQALLELAPHLVHELPIFVPLYQIGQHPYYRIGLRLYDRLAGKYALHRSEFVPREHVHDALSLPARGGARARAAAPSARRAWSIMTASSTTRA